MYTIKKYYQDDQPPYGKYVWGMYLDKELIATFYSEFEADFFLRAAKFYANYR